MLPCVVYDSESFPVKCIVVFSLQNTLIYETFLFENDDFDKGVRQNMRFLRGVALWSDQQINFFSFFGLSAVPGVSWGPPGGLPWGSWGPPVASGGIFWGLPRVSGRARGASWGVLGISWGSCHVRAKTCRVHRVLSFQKCSRYFSLAEKLT